MHRKEGMERLRELVQLRLLLNCRSVPQGRSKLDADRGSQLNADRQDLYQRIDLLT